MWFLTTREIVLHYVHCRWWYACRFQRARLVPVQHWQNVSQRRTLGDQEKYLTCCLLMICWSLSVWPASSCSMPSRRASDGKRDDSWRSISAVSSSQVRSWEHCHRVKPYPHHCHPQIKYLQRWSGHAPSQHVKAMRQALDVWGRVEATW